METLNERTSGMINQKKVETLEEKIFKDLNHTDIVVANNDSASSNVLNEAIDRYNSIVQKVREIDTESGLVNASEEEGQSKGKVITMRWMSIAATLVLIATFLFLMKNQSSNDSLDGYFTHYDQLVSSRGEGDNNYAGAIRAYSSKDYSLALKLFQGLPEEAITDEIKFYAGISALGAENFEGAIDYLQDIGTTRESRYYENARWYLALGYWQNNELEKTLESLKSFEDGDFKYQESQRLLEQLQMENN